jgi:hypothetical protein
MINRVMGNLIFKNAFLRMLNYNIQNIIKEFYFKLGIQNLALDDKHCT